MGRTFAIVLVLAVAAALTWAAFERIGDGADETARGDRDNPVPVEVAAIERGSMEHRRTFTGTLEPMAEFVVAPKVGGRIEQLAVDLADEVRRGQVVAKLDDDEHIQSVAQAEAEYAVARANLVEAVNLLKIAERELARVGTLHERGVSTESQRDLAKAEQLTKQARVAVTRAEVARAKAELESARIRLGYTDVTADWGGGRDRRVVAERLVDEGQMVTANTPLLRIVEMDPIVAVFFVTERDYALLKVSQPVTLLTDAHAGKTFAGRIARIAPVFRESTRQARVEVRVDNPDLDLKPGMFMRASVVLDRVDDAIIIPEQALVRRDGHDGVFVIDGSGTTASWRRVQIGFRQDGRVQVSGEDLNSKVVTLGQQLLDDNSKVVVTESYRGSAR